MVVCLGVFFVYPRFDVWGLLLQPAACRLSACNDNWNRVCTAVFSGRPRPLRTLEHSSGSAIGRDRCEIWLPMFRDASWWFYPAWHGLRSRHLQTQVVVVAESSSLRIRGSTETRCMSHVESGVVGCPSVLPGVVPGQYLSIIRWHLTGVNKREVVVGFCLAIVWPGREAGKLFISRF